MMRPKSPQSLVAGIALATFLFVAIGVCWAQSTPSRSLLALSKRNHTLAIVDPNTLQVIARVPVGPDPHEVIALRREDGLCLDLRWGALPCAFRDRPGWAESAARHRYRSFEWPSRSRVCGRKGLVHS